MREGLKQKRESWGSRTARGLNGRQKNFSHFPSFFPVFILLRDNKTRRAINVGEEREEEDDDEEKTSLGAQTQMSHPSPGCVGVRKMENFRLVGREKKKENLS